MYLVAIMDWASKKVLAWRLSNTLDIGFCITALEEALYYYGTPNIFNTDQGSQFTSNDFINLLKNNNILISMDGKKVVGWIIFLLRDFGGHLNMNVYIYKSLIQ